MQRTTLSSISGVQVHPRYEVKDGRCRIAFYTVHPDPKKVKLVFMTDPDSLFDGDGNRFDINVPLFEPLGEK